MSRLNSTDALSSDSSKRERVSDASPTHRTVIKPRTLPGNKVFITGKFLPLDLMHKSQQFSALEYHFFSNDHIVESVWAIDQELEAVGVYGAWEAFRMVRPWAFRIDLWRLMILWSEGGIYLDSKLNLLKPIETWAALSEEEEVATCVDLIPNWESSRGQAPIVFQALLAGRKGSQALLDAIRFLIMQVRTRSYGVPGEDELLAVTGPHALGWVIMALLRICMERRGMVLGQRGATSQDRSVPRTWLDGAERLIRSHECAVVRLECWRLRLVLSQAIAHQPA